METGVNFAEVKKEVRRIVAEIAEVPEAELKDEARFAEDLNIDSMMALEIVAGIEKKYKIVIPEEEIPSIRSLQNVYALLEKRL